MGLLDDVAAEPRKVSRHPQCIAGRLIATLNDDERAELLAAFKNPEFTTAAIFRVLNRRGLDVKQEALSRHRATVTNGTRKCSCEPRG